MAARTKPGARSHFARHRIAITGVTGTLGRNLLDQIVGQPGTTALALLRDKSRLTKTHDSVHYENVDFLDANSVASLIREFRPTAFIHSAASGMQTPRPSWAEMVRFNVDVSVQLCEIAAQIPGCQFVYISTGLAYRDQSRPLREDDPLETLHPYAASKAAAESLVRAAAAESGVPLTILRPFSFSGVGDVGTRLFPSLLRAAEQKRPFDLSPGDQIRDHCAVSDIARGVLLAMTRNAQLPPATHVFNLGSGSMLSLRKLVENVVEELGLEVTLKFGACGYSRFEPKCLAVDISHARTLLQWEPQTNFAYAVWQLAQESFPSLKLKQPKRER